MRTDLLILLIAGLTVGCLPDPQSVREERENFPRGGLLGSYILDGEPSGMNRVEAVFGGRLKLNGYLLEPAQPEPGDRVHIDFFWSASSEVAEDYQIFIHGDAIGGRSSRLHADHWPADRKYPTHVWQKGEVIRDPFVVWIPPNYGPKRLGINTGLYKGNYRVPLTNKGVKQAGSDNRSRAIEIHFK